MDRDPGEEEEFDLRLDWEDDSYDLDDEEAVAEEEIEEEEIELVRSSARPASSVVYGDPELSGGADLEEVREHIAAAFDAVRELAVQVETLVERVETLTDRFDTVPVEGAGAGKGNGAKGDAGKDTAAITDQIDAVGVELAGLIEGRLGALEEALGNDLDDFGDQLARMADAQQAVLAAAVSAGQSGAGGGVLRPPVETADGAEGGGHEARSDVAAERVASQLSAVVERLLDGQAALETRLTQLTEEVVAYRRRVQTHARPPVISDDKVQHIVRELLAGLGGTVGPEALAATPSVERATPDIVWQPERAAAPAAPAEPAGAEPADAEWADAGPVEVDGRADTAPAEDAAPAQAAPAPPAPAPKGRGRRKKEPTPAVFVDEAPPLPPLDPDPGLYPEPAAAELPDDVPPTAESGAPATLAVGAPAPEAASIDDEPPPSKRRRRRS